MFFFFFNKNKPNKNKPPKKQKSTTIQFSQKTATTLKKNQLFFVVEEAQRQKIILEDILENNTTLLNDSTKDSIKQILKRDIQVARLRSNSLIEIINQNNILDEYKVRLNTEHNKKKKEEMIAEIFDEKSCKYVILKK